MATAMCRQISEGTGTGGRGTRWRQESDEQWRRIKEKNKYNAIDEHRLGSALLTVNAFNKCYLIYSILKVPYDSLSHLDRSVSEILFKHISG